MYRLFTLALLLTVLGCADEPSLRPAAVEVLEERTTEADPPSELMIPRNDPPLEYPEKAEVERLLVRAAELESNGKFEQALAVANQAVAMDSSSPSANEMKARLEELLRRIQAAPQFNGPPAASKVAQRTTP